MQNSNKIKNFGINSINVNLKKYLIQDGFKNYLDKNIIIGHKNLDFFFKEKVKKNKFYLLIGRGPNKNLNHIGHFQFWDFAKRFQKKYNLKTIIHLTNDEKYLESTENVNLYEGIQETFLNIMATGFQFSKTKFIVGTDSISHLYPSALKLLKIITFKKIIKIFGFTEKYSIGRFFFPILQLVPTMLSKTKRVVIICGIDQDPYFRLASDLCEQFGYLKPIIIYKKLFPAVNSFKRMESRNKKSSIYLSDSDSIISKKVRKIISGGGKTLFEHEKQGVKNIFNCNICNILNEFFIDESFENIFEKYTFGKINSENMKKILLEKLLNFFFEYRKKNAQLKNISYKNFLWDGKSI